MDRNRNDQEFLNELEHATPEKARELLLQAVRPECRSVASNFFNCVEDKIKQIDEKEASNQSVIEKKITEKIIPDCMRSYDLESCLAKYDNNNI
jgi:hypothetical protein